MRYLLILIAILFSGHSYATAWGAGCTVNLKQAKISLPSGLKFFIDPNLPIGSVLYSFLINPQSGLDFMCTTPASFSYQFGYVYGAGGNAINMSGYGLISQSGGSYPVYKTNVDGVGVVIKSSGYAFPYWWPSKSASNVYLNFTASTYQTVIFEVLLIKYAEIPEGAKTVNINSSLIPDIFYEARIYNSSDKFALPNGDVPLVRFSFDATSISIITSTCDTPDMTVNLGDRKLVDSANMQSGMFVTQWVDASIRLTNCPVFYGIGVQDGTRSNVMTVTLLPSKATTSSQGIMPIDTDSSAAAGVGIQLAYGTAASPQLVDFSTGKAEQNYTMSSTQGTTYTIPLVARYYQTAGAFSDIMPGKANGKITYLINYY